MRKLDENYWNNKWPKAPIIYNGRALRGPRLEQRIAVDVKKFISTDDEIMKQIVSRYRLQKRDPDDTALTIQKWIVRFMTYKYDEVTSNVPEFWQFPFETIQSEDGDCEDGAILMTTLMTHAGIPNWRVKVAAGFVQASPTAPQGGHAYTLYLANDGEWRILDWCYLEDSHIRVQDKPLAKNGGQRNAYKEIWFTFNDQHSWNQKSLCIKGRVANNRAELSDNSLNEIIDKKDDMKILLKEVDQKYKKKKKIKKNK